jgi:hypothetical protein
MTPCVLQVKRVDKMTVTVVKPGYQPEAFTLVPQAFAEGIGTSVGGNLLVAGGVVGLLVDGVSGAGLDKCPNPIRITLRQSQQSGPRGAPSRAHGQSYDPVLACKEQYAAKQGSAAEARN